MGRSIIFKNKGLLGIAALIFTTVFIFLLDTKPPPGEFIEPPYINNLIVKPLGVDNKKIEKWWSLRKNMKNLSKLGEILFLDSPEPDISNITEKRYQILVWKYGSTIENRHLKQFSGHKIDPFAHCPVKNCDITYKDSAVKTADIVIFHLHRTKNVQDVPKERNPNQIWAFLTDESPYHTFMTSKNKLKDFNGVFNWSMTYRMDSDIPVPYGRTVLKKNPVTNMSLSLVKRRDVLVAILGSNCGGHNKRWQYVKELQKYMQVDVYGGCGTTLKKGCPGHFGSDCPAINQYLFYLSFENSNCDEYITEKLWWNAFEKNSIPIVMGASQSYKTLLPVNSYIDIEDFAGPQVLAQYLIRLNQTEDFKRFYDWKTNFEVRNEHGYFQSKSYHYCRICQALNYNTKEKKVYNDLENFWSVKKDCHAAWN